MPHTRFALVVTLIAVATVAAAPSSFDTAVVAAARTAAVAPDELLTAAKAGLWNRDKSAVAVAVKRPAGTLALVFVRRRSGEFLAVDVSAVENGNLRKLGLDRRHLQHFDTAPVTWLPRDDDLLQVEFRTRVWSSGQRYTASEPIIIRRDGTPLWR